MREILQWRTFEGAVVTEPQPFAVHAWMNVTFTNEATGKSASTLAFLDTGISGAALSMRLISQLELKNGEPTEIHTNTETKTVATYQVAITVPSAPRAVVALDCIELENPFVFPEAEAIVGMGFLRCGALVLQPIGMDSFFQVLPGGDPLIRLEVRKG